MAAGIGMPRRGSALKGGAAPHGSVGRGHGPLDEPAGP